MENIDLPGTTFLFSINQIFSMKSTRYIGKPRYPQEPPARYTPLSSADLGSAQPEDEAALKAEGSMDHVGI